jgi:hypothetical protein
MITAGQNIILDQSIGLPSGSNTIGNVNLNAGSNNIGITSPQPSYAGVVSGSGNLSQNTVVYGPIQCTSYSNVVMHMTTITGGGSLSLQISNDNINYTTIPVSRIDSIGGSYASAGMVVSINATNSTVTTPLYGAQYFRVIAQGAFTSANIAGEISFGTFPATNIISLATILPSANYGNKPFATTSANNTAVAIKASAGTLSNLSVSNESTNFAYVKVYNGTPTLGTTSAVLNLLAPKGSVQSYDFGASGVNLSTNINIAVTGAFGLSDNTSITGNIAVNAIYI